MKYAILTLIAILLFGCGKPEFPHDGDYVICHTPIGLLGTGNVIRYEVREDSHTCEIWVKEPDKEWRRFDAFVGCTTGMTDKFLIQLADICETLGGVAEGTFVK